MNTKDEALRLALEALEYIRNCETDVSSQTKYGQAEEVIKQALAQPEPEPVAFYVYKPALPRGHLGNVSDGDLPWVYDQDPSSGYSARMLVYTSPPKREWQGLTDEEKQDGNCKKCKDGCPACDARRQSNVLP